MAAIPHPCPVCGADAGPPIWRSPSETGLTSLCERRPGRALVHGCRSCGHLFGEPMDNIEAFYEEDYRILIAEEDEDQIYEERDGTIVYRVDHQLATLRNRITLSAGARVLDFGCAKAAMARRLGAERPDLELHLFDVSHMYKPFWDRFVPDDRQAIHETPNGWNGRFDLVTSYFAFEHIADPVAAMRHVHRLLAPGGMVYGIVPHVFSNVADFIVIDHVNHFTRASLSALLSLTGFGEISVDAEAHRGALVFSARKTGQPGEPVAPDGEIARAEALARFWSGIDAAIRAEEKGSTGPAAIYGSGFYGAYILTSLAEPDRVTAFLDRNPYLQGRELFGKPILAPEALDPAVTRLWAGLNPAIARSVLDGTGWMAGRGLSVHFLDEAGTGGGHA